LALGHHAQAPSIHFRAGWYYLFFATGNYRTDFTAVVGRSRSLFGPYADRAGVELMRGGRTVVTQGTADLIAPANGCVLTWEGRDYFVTNVFRTAADGGKTAQRELVICPLVWDAAGWPSTALTPRP
jgi:arabinan endo-1,5-alpha-L-arabinosidase